MVLDGPTLGLSIVVVYTATLYYTLLLAWRKHGFPGDRAWLLGMGVLTVGFVLKNFSPSLPLLDSVAYIGLAWSNILFAHALWTFRWGRNFPWEIYASFPISAALVILTLIFAPDLLVPGAMILIGLGSLFPAVLAIVRTEGHEATSLRLVGWQFAGFALSSLVGAALTAGSTSLTASPGIPVLFSLGALLLAAMTSFGFSILGTLSYRRVVEKKDTKISLQNQVLREQNRSKDLFFSIIAHDLRGPISGVARYTRKHLLAKMSGLEHKYKEVETLAAALDKTHAFLEKLLWWSRSQLVDWTPTWTRVNLDKVLTEAASVVGPLAEQKSIRLVFPEIHPVELMADEECMNLILVNLLSNAIKFSHPASTVTIETATVGKSFEMSVVDEGIGMDERTLERLFLIENKLSTQGTQGEAGSGMGLILAQTLAQRNDGGIEIKSSPGQGTRATLWLPLRHE